MSVEVMHAVANEFGVAGFFSAALCKQSRNDIEEE